MWEKLIRQQDRNALGVGLEHIEDPFFAVNHVRRYLGSYEPLPGLDQLKSEFGCNGLRGNKIPASTLRRLLEAVERGDWLLVLDKPFSPLSRDHSNRWSAITGKRVLESIDHPPIPAQKPSPPRAEYTQIWLKPDPVQKPPPCTFTKPRALPDGAIDYTGFGAHIPIGVVRDYGTFAWLGCFGHPAWVTAACTPTSNSRR